MDAKVEERLTGTSVLCMTPSTAGEICEHDDFHTGRHSWQPEQPATSPARRVIRVPQDAEFGADDFIAAAGIQAVADRLIGQRDDLQHLREDCQIIYVWKRKGGVTGGHRTLGKTQKPSGLLRHFSQATFVVWIAADHARDLGFSERDLEALTYHELLHTAWEAEDEDTPDIGRYTLVGHDVEAFAAEIRAYGLWKQDLREMGQTIKQLRLDVALTS